MKFRNRAAMPSRPLCLISFLSLEDVLLDCQHTTKLTQQKIAGFILTKSNYASLLWQLFRALIEGALESLVQDFGRQVIQKIIGAIDQTVEAFLNEALQISPSQVSAQLKAEELGYL